MGLGGITWVKGLLRTDPRFEGCMHDVGGGGEGAPRQERGFDVVMVELMLRKRALVKGCQTLGQYARRWITLAEEQLTRFPDARTMVFLFDDETNVPHAKGETQESRRRNLLSAEEQVLLGPYRYLCNANPREFDTRVNALFGAEAMRRERAGRTKVSAFEVFAEKHMATSALREDEFEFATRCIAAANYARLAAAGPKPACRIIVDRGVWRPSFERRLATDPARGGEEAWHAVAGSFLTPEERARQARPADRLRLRLDAIDQLGAEAREAWQKRSDYGECANRFERLVYMVRLGMVEHEARLGEGDVLAGAFCEVVEQAEALGREERAFAARPVSRPLSPNATQERAERFRALQERIEFLRHYLEATAGAGDGDGEGCGEPGGEAAARGEAERCWILIDATGVRRLDGMEGAHLVGEADLKIPRYARVFAGRDVFVVCHDSDLIPILLLAVKDWVPLPRPGGAGRRVPGRLWLDITTASDLKKRPVPPGVLDVVAAWRAIHHWYADAYPGVRNPVEVFCLLLVMMGTDYVKNPPGLGAKTLVKGFEKLASRALQHIIATDGLLGGALPPPWRAGDKEARAGGEGGAGDREEGAEEAAVVRLLRRNVLAGSFYETCGETAGELLPPGRRHRYIAIREGDLVRYFSELYAEVGPRDRNRWPKATWWQAQARRLIWQMAYWYGGDTAAGRVCDDEMLEAPAAGAQGSEASTSLYGWQWRPVDGAGARYGGHRLGVREALERGAKRKRGALGRYRPRDPRCNSVPVEPVATLRVFKRVRRERYEAYLGWLDDAKARAGRGGGGEEEAARAPEKKNTQVGF